MGCPQSRPLRRFLAGGGSMGTHSGLPPNAAQAPRMAFPGSTDCVMLRKLTPQERPRAGWFGQLTARPEARAAALHALLLVTVAFTPV